MNYTVEIFYNTGFDTVNIPATPAVLRAAAGSIQTAEAVRLVQDRQLASVRINKSWENIKDADYIRIGATYYAVVGCQMISDLCAELILSPDYITTAGGVSGSELADLTATATRITPKSPDDWNTLAEPVGPSQPLERHNEQTAWPTLNRTQHTYIGATVDLDSGTLQTLAQAFEDADGNVVGYFPTVPQINKTTTFYAQPDSDETDPVQGWSLPGEALYKLNANPEALKIVQSLGITDSIVDRYLIPQDYIFFQQLEPEAGGVQQVRSIQGRSQKLTVPLTYWGNYVPKYGKTKFLNRSFYVISRVTGDVKVFPWIVYRNPTSGEFELFLWTDPNPKGCPYIRPVWNNGAKTQGVQDTVRGATWYNPQRVFEGAAGGAVTTYNIVRDMHDNAREYKEQSNQHLLATAERATTGATSTVLSGLAGSVGAITSAESLGFDLAKMELQQKANTARAIDKANDLATANNISRSVFVPTIQQAQGDASQISIGNNFCIVSEFLSDTDAQILDDYYNRFGYAVPAELITVSDLSRGKNFTYIEAGDINLGNAFSLGTTEKRGIISQLMNGVRIWKTKPTAAKLKEANYD